MALCAQRVIIMVMGLVLVFSTGVQAQFHSVFESILFDSSVVSLEFEIKESSRCHAIYSYNIANASTPDFQPLYCSAEEAVFISQIAPPGVTKDYFNKVLMEYQTTNLSKNRSRQSALYALYRKKIDNYRQIVSLGKK